MQTGSQHVTLGQRDAAYLRWRPVSTSRWRWSVRAGAFFPLTEQLYADQRNWAVRGQAYLEANRAAVEAIEKLIGQTWSLATDEPAPRPCTRIAPVKRSISTSEIAVPCVK